jgi:NAD(P)-dependent dehydrogenase (short-subunit alcohol dehydrogenase family)
MSLETSDYADRKSWHQNGWNSLGELVRARGLRRALVTGGTDGIGKEAAHGLAFAGYGVIVVGRDRQKGTRAVDEISLATGNPDIGFIHADLSLMSEANRLADEVGGRWTGLNYLVHSAGVVRQHRDVTSEGVESSFAINYLSRFVLTQRLLPLMDAAGRPGEAARIVLVSGAAKNGLIYFDDVNLTSKFGVFRAVGQFCRANDVFTVEQARRLAGKNVTIVCIKMGVVRTNIRNGRDFPWWLKILAPLVMDPLLGQAPKEAADSVLKPLLAREYEGISGAVFMKIKNLRRVTSAVRMNNAEIGKQLWDLSERLSRRSGEVR